jgi:N-acetylneuraminate synthase/N,N'-diacetyllegionaminate synthase
MGAQVLEFHFTDSREGKEFRDHKVSVTPDEVRELQRDVAQITALRGSRIKLPQESEIEQGHVQSFRRGAYLRRAVAAGQRIEAEDVCVLRPNVGVDARDAGSLVGRLVRTDIAAWTRIEEGMV